uniref:Coagulation factor II (thrombin) receptor-like 1, tandem duplicate 2 n=1 Tax=Hucho hucho TaxID=62062 RepID=A0A4W5K7C0_9TELE
IAQGNYVKCFIVASCIGHGFNGVVDPQDADRVTVDKATAETLRRSLTTVFLPIVYTVVFALGLPTNAIAIWVFLFRTKKKHPAAIYMANLALSDLLFVIWTPLKITYHLNGNNWIYGERLCKVLVGFFYGNIIQRYWVVAHPLSHQNKNNKMAIALKDLNITTCHDVNIIHDLENPFPDVALPYFYFVLMAGIVFLVPSLVIILAYILLRKALVNSMTDRNPRKNRQKAMVLIVTVLVTFLLCFVPSNIMLVIHYTLLKVINNGYGFYITTLCLASLNSCLDPFIYYFVSEDFRDHVKNTLPCRSSRTVERMRVSFSSMKYSKKSKAYVSESENTKSSTC